MGTNYDAIPKGCAAACRHCCMGDQIHLGKSGNTLRGYQDGVNGHPPITTWAEWKRFLREDCVGVVDEYGRDVSVEDIITLFESSSLDVRGRSYRWDEAGDMISSNRWMDDEGFSFIGGEFC